MVCGYEISREFPFFLKYYVHDCTHDLPYRPFLRRPLLALFLGWWRNKGQCEKGRQKRTKILHFLPKSGVTFGQFCPQFKGFQVRLWDEN